MKIQELEKLSAPIEFKALMVFVVIAACISVFTFEFQAISAPIIILVIFLAATQLEDYYLGNHFIKKRKEKIFHNDIEEVRKLLWWWIITDEYGDSMWVNYTTLKKQDKLKLSNWLKPRVQEPKLSEQNDADNQ